MQPARVGDDQVVAWRAAPHCEESGAAHPDRGARIMSTTAQLITGVDFVTVPTHDLEAAVKFYSETLGLPCSVHLKDRNFAEFETGNLTLSVIDAEAMGLEHHAQKGISLHVEDIEEARRTLEGRGLVFQGD